MVTNKSSKMIITMLMIVLQPMVGNQKSVQPGLDIPVSYLVISQSKK